MNILSRNILMMLFAVLALIGCGGGGDSAPPTTLSGTAAVGFPIVNGAVNVTCAAGAAVTGIANTSATGAWSVTLSGQTLPCAVQVSGGTINSAPNITTYQSIANAYGTVNVTPLTGLVVANLTGAVTALTQAQLAAFNSAATPLSTQLTTSLTNLRTAFGLAALSTIDPFYAAFSPVSGVVMDDILTALRTAMTTANVTYANLLAAAGTTQGAAITLPAGLTPATLAAAYANTTSGGSGSGTTATVTGFSPNTGAVGTSVTITGTNLVTAFPPAPIIKFDTFTATVTGSSNTSMTVTVPAGLALGAHTITIGGMSGTPLNVGNFDVTSTGGTVPAAPTVSAPVVVSATAINVSWATVTGATAYNVYRSTTSPVAISAGNRVTTPPVGDTAFGDSGLTASTTYYYKVTAINATGESVGSAEVSATTNAGGGGAVLAAPTVNTPIVVSSAQINLSWSASSGAIAYKVYRSTTAGVAINPTNISNGTITAVSTVPTTISIGNLLASTTYYFKVVAVDATGGESPASAEVSATTTASGALVWSNTGGSRLPVVYDRTLFLNGQFRTISAPGIIRSSTDGTAWTTVNAGVTGDAFLDLAFGNGKYVAVGVNIAGGGAQTGLIKISTDGIAWTAATLPAGLTCTQVTNVIFANGQFMAACPGNFGFLMTSTDGITWTQVSSTSFWPDVSAITFGNGLYVAVGGLSSFIQTSPNGINWTIRVSSTTGGKAVGNVLFAAGQFVVVAANGTILTSPDGIAWTSRVSGTTRNLNDVAYGNGLFAIAGSANTLTGTGTLLTSPDGVTWTLNDLTAVAPIQNLHGIAFGNTRFIAAGSLGAIITAP